MEKATATGIERREGKVPGTLPCRLVGRASWAFIAALSYCAALALSMRFAMPELSEKQRANPLAEIVWNLRGSLSGTSVSATLLFAGLVALGAAAWRMRAKGRPPRALLPVSLLVSLVWLMGVAFAVDNRLESLDDSPGQVVKSICYVLGTTYLLYELGLLLFYFLEGQKAESSGERGRLAKLYARHPFRVSFLAILLCWLPHLVAAYPGRMCYDAWNELAQFFGVKTFEAAHPPVHTLFLGMFVQLGLKLGSGNLGLYLSMVVQTLVEAAIFAYTLYLMKGWQTSGWLRIGSFCLVVACPYYVGYVGVGLKDNLYAAWVVLFVAECICLLQGEERFFSRWSHKLLLALSIMGVLLFRHNGKLILFPTLLALGVYFWAVWWRQGAKKSFGKLTVCFLVPVLLATGLNAALMAHYELEKDSVGASLSLPFQQTARYVLERGDEVTEEEAQAIGAVLDYENLAQNYNPRISDLVKETYNQEASREDLLRYFATWLKMFCKHPEIYLKATMNQNYYLVYPFARNDVVYTSTFPEVSGWFVEPASELLGITEPERLSGARDIARGSYSAAFSLPVLGLLSNQATYNLLLIALVVFAVYEKKRKWLLASLPLTLTSVGIIFAPVIQWCPRYAFPVIYAMPLMLAYYIHLGKGERTKV